MKRFMLIPLIVFLCILFIPIQEGLFAQEPAVEEGAVELARDIQLSRRWKLGPSITVPPLMLRESTRPNAKFDVVFTAGVGAGLSFKYVEVDPITGEEITQFSVSPFTVIFSGDLSGESNNLNVIYAITAGFFRDLIMVGAGINLGSNIVELNDGTTREISRFCFFLGLGMSFGGD